MTDETRSHTKSPPVRETSRLVGTLDGHLEGYRHQQLPASVSTAVVAAVRLAGTSIPAQPAYLQESVSATSSAVSAPLAPI